MSIQYIVMDFEMNPVAKNNKDARIHLHREIIEIGAVKVNADNKIVDRFKCYVKPQYNCRITPFITQLTGISSFDVCAAYSFEDAIAAVESWIGYDAPAQIYSWSQSDLKQLQNECTYKQVDLPDNMNDWVDFQSLYADVMGFGDQNRQMSLHRAAEQFGIMMDEKTSHSALYDAEITAELLITVLSGEYKQQAELLHNCVLQESDKCGYSIGDTCGGILQQLLQQLNGKQDYVLAR